MVNFIPYDRSQSFLLAPDLRDWIGEDDLVHFITGAAERVDIGAFKVNWRGHGKAQYHPRMMLALLIYCYANGIFSSRRIERATHRDVAVRYIAADTHPGHDTIATFRRENLAAFSAAFAHVLLLAKELKQLKLGMVSIDGTKLDANASKIKSVRYDRAQALREKLAEDIAALTARAAAADVEDAADSQALPAEIARREVLKAKLDEACARLKCDARAAAADEQADYEERLAAWEARNRRGRKPKPPDDTPPPDRQGNLTDPDSKLMRKSTRHESKTSNRRRQSQIQTPKMHRRTGLRHHQERPRIYPLLAQRRRKRQNRMAPRRPRIQLQAPLQPQSRLGQNQSTNNNRRNVKSDRLLV